MGVVQISAIADASSTTAILTTTSGVRHPLAPALRHGSPGERRKTMNVRNILSTLALTGVLFSSAWAGHPPVAGSDDLSSFPYGEAVVRPDPMTGAAEDETSTTIEGRVAAIEPDLGRLVLDTELGPFSVMTQPEQLAGIEIGDTVRVALAT